jgi:hypothetical protein
MLIKFNMVFLFILPLSQEKRFVISTEASPEFSGERSIATDLASLSLRVLDRVSIRSK